VQSPSYHLLLQVLLLLGPVLLLQLAALLHSCWEHRPNCLTRRVRQQQQAQLTNHCCTKASRHQQIMSNVLKTEKS
jgi:hypothetical protein